MPLLKLPKDKQELILNDDPAIQHWQVRSAVQAGSNHERWHLLVKNLDAAEQWQKLINQGTTQSHIAKTEGITKARVCQLIRLTDLDDQVKKAIREGDKAYYGMSLRQVLGRF